MVSIRVCTQTQASKHKKRATSNCTGLTEENQNTERFKKDRNLTLSETRKICLDASLINKSTNGWKS
ncbi:Hypothetical predicted protein [Cloeon dipterum]|uniref:Uncharacterized protein n=1 Tax=Cloeon dipterum TaxID=197152 RepID=A0A8S1C3U9_9INSE|nr:Hypothetical predicted protein [Cloeon dipterum]